MPLTWKEQLEKALVKQYGDKKGSQLSKKYYAGFHHGYSDDYPVSMAVSDVGYMESLSDKHTLALTFYFSTDKNDPSLHLRLFQWQTLTSLSDILPMLENLDLRTDSEHPDKIILSPTETIFISDFSIAYTKGSFDLNEVKDLFQEAFSKVFFGCAENDGFNKLVLAASLSWREIMVLRAYAKYLRQVGFRFFSSLHRKSVY